MATLLDRPGTSATSAHTPLLGVRVLAVDDDDDALYILAALLRAAGAEVQTACDAEEALAALQRWWPTVIVSDIGMPGRDGYELIGAIRSLPGGEGIPAAALTGRATVADVARALAAGFQMHLSKPADADQLIAGLAHLARAPRRPS